jgi:outer membrane protein, multidrug efflux system
MKARVNLGFKRLWASGVAIAAALALGACATPTPPVAAKAQLPTPTATFAQAPAGAPASAEPAARFWQRFGDADLNALVTEALDANRDVRVAVARLREARANERLASVGDLPSVGAQASVGRVRAPGNNGTQSSGAYGVGGEVLWEWDLFGRRADGKAAAAADTRSSQAQVQAARLAVAGEVARLYFELRGLQERLRVAEESLLTQREALKLVQGRLEVGRGTALDTERARALVLGTEASVPALQLAITLTSQRLAVLRGVNPSTPDARLAAVKPMPGLQAVPLADVGSPEGLLKRRPDLQAAEAQAVAAASRAGLAYKARFPSVSLGGTFGLNAGRLADIGKGASFVYNLGASLAYSVFDNGARAAQTDAAQARELAAVIAYEQAVLAALEEAEGALATYTRTQQQAQSLFAAAQAADKAAEIARGRFGAGVSDFLAVLDAERERLAARDRLAVAQAAAAVSVVTVYKSLGGDVGSAAI